MAGLRRLVARAFEELEDHGWLQSKLGKDCTDDPVDIGAVVLEKLGRDLWPFSSHAAVESEEWLFTIIEFAFDHVSKPLESFQHKWNGCGTHVLTSDDDAGCREVRERMNSILGRYERPFVGREDGEVWESAPSGLDTIEPEPSGDRSIDDRVSSAIRAFRRHGATEDDKRHALRDLADVLEYLRGTAGTQLASKDEGELFNIANNFAIRHYNPKQKTQYDSGVWLDWMFYSFLSSIELAKKLLRRGT